ncbi:hypothetical protein KUTeg_014621 [Tegillarca granosa]|uniref:Uncharacterized protein n=1 Tax=Tegillarca granosa TaxID=220873 RepID=A0ABQ9ERI5_TEGGR|nr:hypothetical protein KUTeg_014621 [Tegillarca granosa]
MEEIHSDQLSIFEVPPMDTAIQSREWVEYRPINQISDFSPVEFQISPLSSGYMDLKNSALKVKLRLTTANDEPVQTDDSVGLVNLALHSVFTQADCSLQQTGVSQIGTNYPYKAYIDTLLNTHRGRETALRPQLYIKDENDLDSADPNGTNSGLYSRFTFTRSGQVIDLEGPVMLDIFQQDRLIVNGVSLSLKFWPSKNTFRLMSSSENAGYKVQILDASFKLCVQKPNPAVLMAHAKEIKSVPARKGHCRLEVRFSSPLPESITLLMYGKFPQVLYIDEARSVFLQ